MGGLSVCVVDKVAEGSADDTSAGPTLSIAAVYISYPLILVEMVVQMILIVEVVIGLLFISYTEFVWTADDVSVTVRSFYSCCSTDGDNI